jgi:hypothetical protein
MEYFVSPGGGDLNDGSEAKPFRTLKRAQRAVREALSAGGGDVVVHLAAGRHTLDEPLVFEPEDGGNDGRTVTYAGGPGAVAVLDGGHAISGWSRLEGDTYERWCAPAALPGMRQLYVNGRRALRTFKWGFQLGRLEPLANGCGYRTAAAAAADLVGARDVEFIYRMMWTNVRCRMERARDCGAHFEIYMQQPEFRLACTKGGVQLGEPWLIEGAPEVFAGEGLWNFEPEAGRLLFKPWAYLDMEKVNAVAPRLETLVEVRGTPDRPVRNLRFEHLGFEHATWLEPSRTGFIEGQANFRVTKEIPLVPHPLRTPDGSVTFEPPVAEYARTPGAVLCRGGENIAFEKCHFARLGGCGLDILRGSNSVRVRGCEFWEVSGNAVQVGDVLPDDHHPADPRLGVRDVEIAGCHIHHVATEFLGGVGVFVGYARNVAVRGNELHHLPYTGVSLGWGWGSADLPQGGSAKFCRFGFEGPALSGGHTVEGNTIRDAMQTLNDGGAIYTLGRMLGTRIVSNIIRDCPGYPGGIYLDQGTADVLVEGNDISRVPKAIQLNNHAEGRDRTCVVRDNRCDAVEAPKSHNTGA